MEGKLFYRYVETHYEHGTTINLAIYEGDRETPCGWWIGPRKRGNLWSAYDKPRWISNTSRKRFAHPTELEAMEAFRWRKKSQIRILSTMLNRAERSKWAIENMIAKEKGEEPPNKNPLKGGLFG